MTTLGPRTSPFGEPIRDHDSLLGHSGGSQGRTTRLLDADPDLATGLWGEQFLLAGRGAVARVIDLRASGDGLSWIEDGLDASGLGLFVLEGLLVRSVAVGGRSAAELLGAGDLIGPSASDRDDGLPGAVQWQAVGPTTVAVLDSQFVRRIASWPTITAQLSARATHRATRLALIQAVVHNPRVAPRLLTMFWIFAQRWGRVGRDGIHITLPLTHTTIADLVGATRPTVTSALQHLSRAELLRREPPHRWLLTNQALAALDN